MSKLIKEILDALNAVNQNKTQPYDRQGEVKRIEGKTAWVKLEGSDRETPIQMTIACDVGDTVQARIGGGSAWLTGNLTAPPTDDKKANEAITMVTTVVQEVQEQVEEALEETTDVEDVTMQYCLSDSSSTFVQYGDWSDTPPEYVSGKYYWVRSVIYDDEGNETYGTPRYSQGTQLSVETEIAFNSNNNHFWYNSSGAYVTTANNSYSSGYATRITTNGILQSYNGNTLSSWTSSGVSFYNSSGSMLASFGGGGASIYSSGTEVANFGSTIKLGNTANGYTYIELDNQGINFNMNRSNRFITSSLYAYQAEETSTKFTLAVTDVENFEVESDMTVSGGIIANGHSSAIGTKKDAYLTADKTVQPSTGTMLCSVSLEAGVWVVSCGVRFPANSTGVRRANLTSTSGDTDIQIQLSASSSNTMQLAFTRIVAPSSTTTYYLNAWHSASSALTLPSGDTNIINYIRAVRIA